MEVQTDKVLAKIPSSCDGIVTKLNFDIDEDCLVGHSLLTIAVDGEDSEVGDSASVSSSEEEAAVQVPGT